MSSEKTIPKGSNDRTIKSRVGCEVRVGPTVGHARVGETVGMKVGAEEGFEEDKPAVGLAVGNSVTGACVGSFEGGLVGVCVTSSSAITGSICVGELVGCAVVVGRIVGGFVATVADFVVGTEVDSGAIVEVFSSRMTASLGQPKILQGLGSVVSLVDIVGSMGKSVVVVVDEEV